MSDFNKNRDAISNLKPVSMSKERLEEVFHKTIDDGYISTPTNDRFVVTQEKSRGKVTFPLILISSTLELDEFKSAVVQSLTNVSPVGEEVAVMYKRHGKAVFLCNSRGNKETIKLLKDYCLSFKYYISKGVQREDLTFDELIDIASIGANIIVDDENAEDYVPEFKKEEIRDIACEKYQKEIEEIINKGRSTNEIDKLINPHKTEVEIKENPVILSPPPAPVPITQEPIVGNKSKEIPRADVPKVNDVESTEVNSW